VLPQRGGSNLQIDPRRRAYLASRTSGPRSEQPDEAAAVAGVDVDRKRKLSVLEYVTAAFTAQTIILLSGEPQPPVRRAIRWPDPLADQVARVVKR
jgi:hypothetical protein